MNSTALTLVTGATGLVGNNVVRALLAQGRPVRVLARTTSDHRPLRDLDVEIVPGDIRDAAVVARACAGVRAVVHCAGYVNVGWSQPELYRTINVDGTRHVAQACRRVRGA